MVLRRQRIFKALMQSLGILGLSLGLVQCDKIKDIIDQYQEKPAEAPVQPTGNEPPPPPVTDYAFDIDLRFDDASKKALAENNIQIKVTAAYYGTPNEATRPQADESGILNLGHDSFMVGPTDQIVNVVPNGLKTRSIKDLIDQKPSVIVRTYTSQRLEDGRMIDCTIYDNRFEVAKSAPARVTCRMFRIGRVQFVPNEETPASGTGSEGGED